MTSTPTLPPQAQPCGVTAGPRGEAVSPLFLPLEGPTVFNDNATMVLWAGPVIYTGLVSQLSPIECIWLWSLLSPFYEIE